MKNRGRAEEGGKVGPSRVKDIKTKEGFRERMWAGRG